jgi:hypothetical protein
LKVRDFLGFPSLKEVECTGATLRSELTYLSLTLFKALDKKTLAHLLAAQQNTCNTYTEFASCYIDTGDSRKSVVRTLVADLEGGETTVVGCNVTSVNRNGRPTEHTWYINVVRESKFLIVVTIFYAVLLVFSGKSGDK